MGRKKQQLITSHVSKTGEIKRFIILEDTALAKGIRRIVAVTGDEALQAQRAASEYEKTVLDLKKLQGVALENALKVVGKDLSAATLPTVRKSQLRAIYDGIKKEFDDADKARKVKEAKDAVDQVKTYFEQHPDALFYVAIVNKSGNSKALSQAITSVKGTDKACLLFSVDQEKVNHACVVPKVHAPFIIIGIGCKRI